MSRTGILKGTPPQKKDTAMLNRVDKNRIILMSRAEHKGSRAIAKELNLNRKTVQRVLRKYAEAIAAEDPDEALFEALAETPKDATSIANTLKNEYNRGNTT